MSWAHKLFRGLSRQGETENPESSSKLRHMCTSDMTAFTPCAITLELNHWPLFLISSHTGRGLPHKNTDTTQVGWIARYSKHNGNALVRSSEKGSPSLLSRRDVRLRIVVANVYIGLSHWLARSTFRPGDNSIVAACTDCSSSCEWSGSKTSCKTSCWTSC